MKSAVESRRNGFRAGDLTYSVELIESVCLLAGSPDYLDSVRADLKGCRQHPRATVLATAAAYDWLIRAMSYQGISDEVARNYMTDHGVSCSETRPRQLLKAIAEPKGSHKALTSLTISGFRME